MEGREGSDGKGNGRKKRAKKALGKREREIKEEMGGRDN